MTITDTGDCTSPHHQVTKTFNVTIFKPLTLSAPMWAQACNGTQPSVDFNAGATVGGGIDPYTYLWNFDDPTTVDNSITTTLPQATHIFSAPGGYDVQLTVTDSANPNCSNPPNTVNVTWHIEVFTPIVPQFTATYNGNAYDGSTPICPNGVVYLSSTSTGGGQPGTALNHLWSVSGTVGVDWNWYVGGATSTSPPSSSTTQATTRSGSRRPAASRRACPWLPPGPTGPTPAPLAL